MADTTYATPADVLELLASDPAISGDVIQAALNEAGAMIDAAVLAVSGTVPLVNATDLLIVGPKVARKAAVESWRSVYADTDEPDRIVAWDQAFNALVKGIASGAIKLPGQTTATSGLSAGRLVFRRGSVSDEWS